MGLLQGKRGIIFGALDENSIAWQAALLAHKEGAVFTLSNAPIAMRMGKINDLAAACNQATIIPADASVYEDMENVLNKSIEVLGGKLDFILHSIGMSPNVRKKIHYTESNYDNYFKAMDISAVSLHKLLKAAMAHDAINEWGSVVALTYIAAQRVFPDYNDMADAKSLLESITRSFGYHYGVKKKVRINTISQSPTRTTAGSGVSGFDAFYNYADKLSPLGNASGQDCANYIISMFSDYTRMVTMQNLFHDGGFSFTGVSDAIILDMMKQEEQ
jgi:enoyl-[acyl-carrier protein] reductase I